MTETVVTEDDWTELYSRQWSDILAPGACAHPAKFAPGLIERIYRHLADAFRLPAGSTILDPFAGVATGAFSGGAYGYAWLGVEIEPRFVALGRANLERWCGMLFNGGPARLLEGDSRRLREVLRGTGAAVCVSSPRFESSLAGSDGCMGQSCKGDGYEAVVSSPPYESAKPHPSIGQPEKGDLAERDITLRQGGEHGYGSTAGQLGAVASSPPYEGSAESGNRHGGNGVMGRIAREKGQDPTTQAGRDALQCFRYSDQRAGHLRAEGIREVGEAGALPCRLGAGLRRGGIPHGSPAPGAARLPPLVLPTASRGPRLAPHRRGDRPLHGARLTTPRATARGSVTPR